MHDLVPLEHFVDVHDSVEVVAEGGLLDLANEVVLCCELRSQMTLIHGV